MALKKMAIQAYKDPKFTQTVGDPYSVLVNPDEYSHKYTILYNDTSAQGANGPSPGFNKMGQETVAFTIWFDGTGVVPDFPRLQGNSSVAAQITSFRAL